MSRVVIAGAGVLGEALAEKLSATHEVRAVKRTSELPKSRAGLSWYHADLTTLHGAELALTGAETVVVLAQARSSLARLQRASLDDLDRLLADSVARAAKLVGAKHLVLFQNRDDDVRAPLLEQSGVPLSVLSGGAPDPGELLLAMVNSGPGSSSSQTAPWAGNSPGARLPATPTCSVQRYLRPAAWSALDLARAYFSWLPSEVPLVKTTEHEGVFSIYLAGARVLVFRLVTGRSCADSAWLALVDGKLTGRGGNDSRFEFRVLLDGTTALAALVGYQPSLPWPLYRFTQAMMHERVMRRFGVWLAAQSGSPPRGRS